MMTVLFSPLWAFQNLVRKVAAIFLLVRIQPTTRVIANTMMRPTCGKAGTGK
jgi:hypothetical protein